LENSFFLKSFGRIRISKSSEKIAFLPKVSNVQNRLSKVSSKDSKNLGNHILGNLDFSNLIM
jgi:hypothetical protein